MLTRMDPTRPRAVVGWAVVTGVVAGLLAAIYFSIAGEPLIDDAIAIEERTAAEASAGADAADDPGHPAGEEHADESVEISRGTQRGAGLFVGYALIGAVFGLLLSITALSVRGDWLDPFRRVLVSGVILAGALTVLPWFKYPANPPAVGDPDTADERQRLYFLLIALAGLVLAGAAHLSARLRRRGWDDARRLVVVGAAAGVTLAVVLAVLPANPDAIPSEVPTSLIWRFRVASLIGNLLLWALLTAGFALLWTESLRRRAARSDVPAAAEMTDVAGSGAVGDVAGSAGQAGQNSMPFMAEMPWS